MLAQLGLLSWAPVIAVGRICVYPTEPGGPGNTESKAGPTDAQIIRLNYCCF